MKNQIRKNRTGLRAWQLTVLSLAANGVIGWLLLTGRRFLPGMLLLLGGLHMVVGKPGEVLRGTARHRGSVPPHPEPRLQRLTLDRSE